MFEWDKSKAKKNQLKHDISFVDTFAVFDDPNAVTIEDFRSDEQRYATIGMDAFGRYIGGSLHMERRQFPYISARKAVRNEVKQYESEI